MAELNTLFEKQTSSIQIAVKQTIVDEIKILGDEFKINLDKQLTQINECIESVEQNVNSQISDLRTDVSKCIQHLDYNDDDLNRLARLTDLKINGIACLNESNENLQEIFCSIAKLIGFDTSNPSHVPELVRSHKRNRQNNELLPLPTIMAKFVAHHIRNKFYGLYLTRLSSQQTILTEHINLPQGGHILIGENLTQHNQSIFKEAIKLKRDKKLFRVNTVDGLVYVKPRERERV